MPAEKHYIIEQTRDGRFAVRAEGSGTFSDVIETEWDAIAHVRMVNPEDHPDVEK
jgi:hypothetical protein